MGFLLKICQLIIFNFRECLLIKLSRLNIARSSFLIRLNFPKAILMFLFNLIKVLFKASFKHQQQMRKGALVGQLNKMNFAYLHCLAQSTTVEPSTVFHSWRTTSVCYLNVKWEFVFLQVD